jgi:putative transposase
VFSDLCRSFSISRKTGYKWLERFQAGGQAALEDRSRTPHASPHAIEAQKRAAIIAVREKHRRWGARKIRERLKRGQPGEQWPAASSIGELLKRAGLIQRRHKRRQTPPYTQPLAHAAAANQAWCADFKELSVCGDGQRCDPLTLTDAFSHYLLLCRAVEKAYRVHAPAVVRGRVSGVCFAATPRTDNGSPFAGAGAGWAESVVDAAAASGDPARTY